MTDSDWYTKKNNNTIHIIESNQFRPLAKQTREEQNLEILEITITAIIVGTETETRDETTIILVDVPYDPRRTRMKAVRGVSRI